MAATMTMGGATRSTLTVAKSHARFTMATALHISHPTKPIGASKPKEPYVLTPSTSVIPIRKRQAKAQAGQPHFAVVAPS